MQRVTFLARLFSVALQARQPTGVTVLEGARLIAGDGSAPVADAAFIVEKGRFTAIGHANALPIDVF